MRKLVIAAGAALAAAAAGVFFAPEKFPLDRYRYQAEWACMQSKPCASFAALFQE